MTVPDLMACVNNISDGISRRGKPFSQNTKHDYILSLKIFTRWMIERKILSIPRSEVQEIDVPRQPKYTKTADDMLSEEEILIVMGVCANSKERAIVATVYDPALRIEELQDLRWGQVQRLKHGVAITTDKKTGYQRRIPCTVCGTYLNAWRNDYPGDPTGNNHVFLTKDREPYQYSGFQYVLRKIRRRLREGGHPEIAAKLGWHVLRHTRLTDYARRGMSETTLGHIGWGHRSAMIECYVHMSRDDIEREVMAIAGIQDDRTEPVKPIFVLGICPSCAFTDVHGWDDPGDRKISTLLRFAGMFALRRSNGRFLVGLDLLDQPFHPLLPQLSIPEFALPYDDYIPAFSFEQSDVSLVPLDIGSDLVLPELSVR